MKHSLAPERALSRPTSLALALTLLFAIDAYAQGVATDHSLETVTVVGNRSPLDPNLPNTTESRTAEQLQEQNFVNVEDALKYLPDVTVRKRYIGDRNALIGGRSSGNLQAPRALVYADGYLLSQFLGQFNAPRWNVVAPEELARVDVLYGPFSALYPGNSIGTTVIMTTRQPKTFEASARVQTFTQHFDDAGFADTYSGHQESAWLGNKVGAWTYTIDVNRLQNHGQPMQYVALQPPLKSDKVTVVPVTGAVAGIDQYGKQWYLAGPSGSAIEDDTQEQIKFKLGYDFSPALYGETLYTHWHNDGRRTGTTLLRDASGNSVYSGRVSINGAQFDIPAGFFWPQNVEEAHDMLGLKLTTHNKTGWNASVVTTLYYIGTDLTRTAAVNPPAANVGGAGTLNDNGGTGWKTIDLQSTYTPTRDESHAMAFGLHSNRYNLDSLTSKTSDWLNGSAGTEISGFYGKTSLQALFAQDTWKISSQWRATLGLRYEHWKAFDGRRETVADGTKTVTAGGKTIVPYVERFASAWSPKASVSYLDKSDWLIKVSFGKGVRFPTVAELFQGAGPGNSKINNDPTLRPELAYSKEISAEKDIMAGHMTGNVRVSLFEDDIRDTIYTQTNIMNVTNIQNIDRVRTRGLEVSAVLHNVGVRGVDLTANAAWSHGEILADAANPSLVGKTWVRVPRVRANAIVSYKPNDRWMGSLAVRHSGRQYNNLDNSDINPGVFGGTSSYTVWDAKLTYRITKNVAASFGVDNLTDAHYYVYHPYPGRTFFGELRATFQ